MERERAEEHKRIEKQKLAITIRHRILATTLERVSAPLKKADLLAVAQYLIAHLPYNQTPQLAKPHKVEVEKDSSSEEQLMKRISTYDEVALGRLLLEISLLDSAYQRFGRSEDALANTAKRYRVDPEKLGKAVAQEFAARHKKQERKKAKTKVVGRTNDVITQSSQMVLSYSRTSSTRRLRARPSSVSLVSTGREAPNPAVVKRVAETSYLEASA